jgi:hypothetical protein
VWPDALGLPEECIVRMKLFTIDNRLVQKTHRALERKRQGERARTVAADNGDLAVRRKAAHGAAEQNQT